MKELVRPPSYYGRANRSKVVRIGKDDPFYRTSNKGNISEPRLVMANHLGRNLTKDDIVYRKNDNYNDNRVENFIVLTRKEFATIRDLKRLMIIRARLDSKISIHEEYIANSGIDLTTLSRSSESTDSRYREVDRDREAYERGRRFSRDTE